MHMLNSPRKVGIGKNFNFIAGKVYRQCDFCGLPVEKCLFGIESLWIRGHRNHKASFYPEIGYQHLSVNI